SSRVPPARQFGPREAKHARRVRRRQLEATRAVLDTEAVVPISAVNQLPRAELERPRHVEYLEAFAEACRASADEGQILLLHEYGAERYRARSVAGRLGVACAAAVRQLARHADERHEHRALAFVSDEGAGRHAHVEPT